MNRATALFLRLNLNGLVSSRANGLEWGGAHGGADSSSLPSLSRSSASQPASDASTALKDSTSPPSASVKSTDAESTSAWTEVCKSTGIIKHIPECLILNPRPIPRWCTLKPARVTFGIKLPEKRQSWVLQSLLKMVVIIQGGPADPAHKAPRRLAIGRNHLCLIVLVIMLRVELQ